MKESKFTGTMLGYLGVRIVSFFITSFTLGIGYPWAVAYKQRWLTKHQTIDGEQLVFTGTGGQLFGNYIKWFLLSIVTLGIYALWLPIKIQEWITKETHKRSIDEPNIMKDQEATRPIRVNTKKKVVNSTSLNRILSTTLILLGLVFLVLLIDIVINLRFGNIPILVILMNPRTGLRLIFILIIMVVLLVQRFKHASPGSFITALLLILVEFVFAFMFIRNPTIFLADRFWLAIIVLTLLRIITIVLTIIGTILSIKQSKTQHIDIH